MSRMMGKGQFNVYTGDILWQYGSNVEKMFYTPCTLGLSKVQNSIHDRNLRLVKMKLNVINSTHHK